MNILIFLIFTLSSNNPVVKENNTVIIEKSDTLKGDLAVVGKDLKIYGGVRGDVAVVAGNVEISGFVSGDLAVVGGNLFLLKGSLIKGDVAVVAGKIKKSEGSKVKGELTEVRLGPFDPVFRLLKFLGPSVKWSSPSEEKEESVKIDTLKKEEKKEEIEKEEEETEEESISAVSRFFQSFINSFIPFILIFIFILIVNIAFPGTSENMKKELKENVWQTLGIGILIQILYLPVIFVLVVSILGIPLAIFIILSTPLLLIYGSAPVFNIIGEFISEKLKIKAKNKILYPFISSLLLFVLLFIFNLLTEFEFYASFYFKPLFMCFTFMYVYLIFTFALGVLFTSRLGIKTS